MPVFETVLVEVSVVDVALAITIRALYDFNVSFDGYISRPVCGKQLNVLTSKLINLTTAATLYQFAGCSATTTMINRIESQSSCTNRFTMPLAVN